MDESNQAGIFDNYVVLHYDPEKKGFALTEIEKKSKKDPILFGVMKGRRILYYVGDWIDDYCDLTLDKFAEMMGGEHVKKILRVSLNVNLWTHYLLLSPILEYFQMAVRIPIQF